MNNKPIISLENLYRLVRLYTFEIGKPCLTLEEMQAGYHNYLIYAARAN